jgi:hypothetical protein
LANEEKAVMKTTAAVTMLLAYLMTASDVRAETVDLTLVLAADVSRSIDDGAFKLQRQGYAAAMTDPRVVQAITSGRNRAIAVTFIEWSGESEQKVVVDWTVVRDEEAAGVVAATILTAPRSFAGRTSISGGVDYAMRQFAVAPAEAAKRILDISGDGDNNSGRPVTEARDQALAAGITINGIAIINTGGGLGSHTNPPGGLPKYYENNVIGGPGAFLLVVENFDTFAEAITRKLVAEIVGLPPPDDTALLSIRAGRITSNRSSQQETKSEIWLGAFHHPSVIPALRRRSAAAAR